MNTGKQSVLKPQDLVVAIKLGVIRHRLLTYAELANELCLSASEVHAATRRAELSRLVRRTEGAIVGVRSSLIEFILHGVPYCFPPNLGGVVRGTPTGIAGPVLHRHFNLENDLVPVWPDAEGTARGLAFQPLYPTVPAAARRDAQLYEVLSLVDAIRGGAARERELAKEELQRRL